MSDIIQIIPILPTEIINKIMKYWREDLEPRLYIYELKNKQIWSEWKFESLFDRYLDAGRYFDDATEFYSRVLFANFPHVREQTCSMLNIKRVYDNHPRPEDITLSTIVPYVKGFGFHWVLESIRPIYEQYRRRQLEYAEKASLLYVRKLFK